MAKRRKSPLLPFLHILLLLPCIFLPANSLANYLTVSWDLTTEPDPVGNQVYYGTASREYVYSTGVGEINAYPLDDLLDGGTYRTAVTAYDTSGNERNFSNEVSVMVNDTSSSSTRDYYQYSPFITQNSEANPSLKATLRVSFAPLVILSQFLVKSTLTDKIVYFLFVLCYSLCIFSWLLKNNPAI